MKKLISAVMLASALVTMAKTSTPEGWTDDYDAALKRAAEENKNIVADFSGSDWCCWCKKLDREVFNTDVFRKGAVDKFVLLMIDSPRDKSLLSEKARKQNPGLVKKYGIRGFPTVLILDASGNQVGRLGYQRGGPDNYLKLLEPYVKEAPDAEKVLKPIKDLLSAPEKEAKKDVAAMEGGASELQRGELRECRGVGRRNRPLGVSYCRTAEAFDRGAAHRGEESGQGIAGFGLDAPRLLP